MLNLHILKRKKPVRCKNLLEWAEWHSKHRKEVIVGQKKVGEFLVSTVFVGMDLSNRGLFETMIFGEWVASSWGKYRESYGQVRFQTWEEAEKGQKEAVAMVKKVGAEMLKANRAKNRLLR